MPRIVEPISRPRLRRGIVASAAAIALVVVGFAPSAVAADPVRVATLTDAQTQIRIDSVVGEEFLGNTNGTHFEVEMENFTDSPQTFGLAADKETAGVENRLWLPESWPSSVGEGFTDLFSLEVGAHSSARSQLDGFLPDWPGWTYGFYRIAIDGVALAIPELVGSYATTGSHVAIVLDDSEMGARIGQPATFLGTEVFPGATTTVTADGLVPGAELGLWLSPGIDYFSFIASGALLSNDAVYAGSGIVGSDGKLSATLAAPSDLPLGSYQLLVGNTLGRNWPAGTTTPIQVVAPANGGVVTGPTAATPQVNVSLGSTSVGFGFDTVTTPGVTTAVASGTGPASSGFEFATSPPLYYYLDTTAAFTGSVEVCINYDPVLIPGGPFSLFHFVAGAWVPLASGPSSASGKACGMTDSFSPFALGISNDVTLTNKQQCKNGGWATSTNPEFANQGQCVKYFTAGQHRLLQLVKKFIIVLLHRLWW